MYCTAVPSRHDASCCPRGDIIWYQGIVINPLKDLRRYEENTVRHLLQQATTLEVEWQKAQGYKGAVAVVTWQADTVLFHWTIFSGCKMTSWYTSSAGHCIKAWAKTATQNEKNKKTKCQRLWDNWENTRRALSERYEPRWREGRTFWYGKQPRQLRLCIQLGKFAFINVKLLDKP